MPISRRTVIRGGAATAVAGALHLAGASSASAVRAPEPKTIISSGRSVSTHFYSADWVNHMALQYPVVLELADASGLEPGFAATLSYDARLFEPSSSVLLYQGSAVRSIPTSVSTDAFGVSLLTFTLDRGLGSVAEDRAIHFSVPLFPKPLYPIENLGSVSPVVFSVQSNNFSAPTVQSWEPTVIAAGVAPWGVEVSAGWQDFVVLQGKKESRYRAPAYIRLDSVGPSPIPAGATIDIEVDARIVSSIDCDKLVLDGQPLALSVVRAQNEVAGESLRARLILDTSVAPGSTLEISTNPTPRPGKTPVKSVRYGSVTVAAPVNDFSPQRDTLKYSIVDLTPSGSPQMENIARGTI